MPRRPAQFRPPSQGRGRPADKAERDRFYTGREWKRCRLAFLREHPLCVDCEALGRLTEATIAHHVRERLERPDLAFDHANLVALCSPCHTARHKAKERP